MNEIDTAGEELSALIDGELEGAALDRAIEAIGTDPDRKARWTRYHVAVDAMKNSLPPMTAPADFCSQVSQAIESEPAILAQARRRSPKTSVQKQLAGLAVAASVAMVAIVGIKNIQSDGQTAQVAQQAPVAAAPVVANVAVPAADPAMARVATDQQVPIPAQIQSQLNRYLLEHNQNAFVAPGMLPYARIVSHGTGESAE